MIRTNYKNHWMLAAILSCGLAMTSCNDVLNVIDNPTTTETEQASAKDQGKWWIDESYMDKSVKPGDNFFMYCLGDRRSDRTCHFALQFYEAHLRRESEQPNRR